MRRREGRSKGVRKRERTKEGMSKRAKEEEGSKEENRHHSRTRTQLGAPPLLGDTLTLIMALDVIRNSVALSVTCRILSPASPPRRTPSSSDKDLRKYMRASHDDLPQNEQTPTDGCQQTPQVNEGAYSNNIFNSHCHYQPLK